MQVISHTYKTVDADVTSNNRLEHYLRNKK